MCGNKEKSSVPTINVARWPLWFLPQRCLPDSTHLSVQCEALPLASHLCLWKLRNQQSLSQKPLASVGMSPFLPLPARALRSKPQHPSLSRKTAFHSHNWVTFGLCQTKTADCFVLLTCQEFIGAYKTHFCSWGNYPFLFAVTVVVFNLGCSPKVCSMSELLSSAF